MIHGKANGAVHAPAAASSLASPIPSPSRPRVRRYSQATAPSTANPRTAAAAPLHRRVRSAAQQRRAKAGRNQTKGHHVRQLQCANVGERRKQQRPSEQGGQPSARTAGDGHASRRNTDRQQLPDRVQRPDCVRSAPATATLGDITDDRDQLTGSQDAATPVAGGAGGHDTAPVRPGARGHRDETANEGTRRKKKNLYRQDIHFTQSAFRTQQFHPPAQVLRRRGDVVVIINDPGRQKDHQLGPAGHDLG